MGLFTVRVSLGRAFTRIITNVMTPDGPRIVITWLHYPIVSGEPTNCMVMGKTLNEANLAMKAHEAEFEAI